METRANFQFADHFGLSRNGGISAADSLAFIPVAAAATERFWAFSTTPKQVPSSGDAAEYALLSSGISLSTAACAVQSSLGDG